MKDICKDCNKHSWCDSLCDFWKGYEQACNDFSKQICEICDNCKYFKTNKNISWGHCDNVSVFITSRLKKDFYCKYWKEK